ncbi:MAG: hypothetical protein ACOCUV_03395 [bacterium]
MPALQNSPLEPKKKARKIDMMHRIVFAVEFILIGFFSLIRKNNPINEMIIITIKTIYEIALRKLKNFDNKKTFTKPDTKTTLIKNQVKTKKLKEINIVILALSLEKLLNTIENKSNKTNDNIKLVEQ